MASSWQSVLRISTVVLAVMASLEPLICPLMGLLHELDCHAAEEHPELDSSHQHVCHGSHDEEPSEDSPEHEDCDHCHQHGLRVLVRGELDTELPAAEPVMIFSAQLDAATLIDPYRLSWAARPSAPELVPPRRIGAPLPLRI